MRCIFILGLSLLVGASGLSLRDQSSGTKSKKSAFDNWRPWGKNSKTWRPWGKNSKTWRPWGKTGASNKDALVNFCNFKKNGDYPSPYDGCKGYIDCYNYRAKYYTCPNGKLYNAKARHCDAAKFVKCPAGILDCDVGIVGGGISGLYMAYELLKETSDANVCVFEKEPTVGGRIRDHRFKEAPDIDVGLGAWRVDKKQLIMLDLLKELKINIKDWSFVEPYLYKSREIEADNTEAIKEGYPALRAHPKFGNMTETELWNYLLKPENVAQAKNYATMFTYMSNMITSEGAYYLSNLQYHSGEIQEMVSPTAYIEWRKILFDLSSKYYRPHGGMSAIIDVLLHEVKAMGGKVYTNTEVQSITREDDVYILLTPNLRVRADKLVVATPPGPFRKIKGHTAKQIQSTPQFDSILPMQAFKGAAVYKTPWWENVTIGNTIIKAGQQFSSSDNCIGASLAHRGYGANGEGVLHTVYTDGRCARRWKDIAQLNKDYIDVEVHRALEAKYGIKIPKPIDTEYQFWDSSWHFQKSNTPFTMVDISNWAKRPFPKEDIFVVGESYDPMRGWCQGAIVSCRHALNEGWGIERVVKHGTTKRQPHEYILTKPLAVL